MSLFRTNVVAVLLLVCAGCNSGKVQTTDAAGKPAAAPADEVLASALFQLNPQNFGLNSNVDKPVSLLNSWRFKQAEQRGTPDEPSPVKAPPGWIDATEADRLAQAKYDLSDAVHIRDAMMYHTIAGYLSDRGQNELQRVNIIVDYVCRNITFWKDDEIELALPAFSILQFGRGNAEDRAWLCALILKQLRIDCVIIRAKSDKKATSDKWLLGVGVERQIYLYDLQLGMPLLNGDGTSTATLADISTHPEWLQQMAVSEPYRLTADDLVEPSVFVMPFPLFWCRRMFNVEQVLPAKNACVLYEPLMDDVDNQPGLLRRISETYNWPIESLAPWKYPSRQLAASQQPTKEAQQELANLTGPFSVPYPIKQGNDGKITVGAPEWKLQRLRVAQLLGDFSETIKRYNSIRHLEVEKNNPQDLDRLNRRAAENAIYWTALCKYEMGEYDSTVEQLTEFLKKYPKGNWFFAARSLLAQSHIQLGEIPQAIIVLERKSADDPYRDGNALRLKRLKKE